MWFVDSAMSAWEHVKDTYNTHYDAMQDMVLGNNCCSVIRFDMYTMQKKVIESHKNIVWLHVLWFMKMMSVDVDAYVTKNLRALPLHELSQSHFVYQFEIGRTKILSRECRVPIHLNNVDVSVLSASFANMNVTRFVQDHLSSLTTENAFTAKEILIMNLLLNNYDPWFFSYSMFPLHVVICNDFAVHEMTLNEENVFDP
jgi:hypothetical protein